MTDGERYSSNTFHHWLAWLILGLLVLVNVVNVLRLETLPFVDLPNHLAEAKIHSVQHSGNLGQEHPLEQQYETAISPIRPNILHLLFCASTGRIETGNRLYYLLYLILLPLSVLLLIRRIGGDPWFSILSVALLYNFNVMWGFSGFTMAIPICMLLVLAAQKQRDNPTPPGAIVLAAGGLLLFYAHALAFLFFLPVYLMMIISGGKKTGRRYLYYLLPIIPAIVVFAIWRFSAAEFKGYESLANFLPRYYQENYWPHFAGRRLAGFFWNDFKWIAWQGAGKSIALILPAAVIFPLVFSLVAGRGRGGKYTRPRRQLLLFCLFAAACFLLLPQGLPKQGFLFHRFSVFVYIGLIAGASIIPPGRVRTAARALAVGCAVLFTGLWLHHFSGFRDWSSGFAEVMRGLDQRKTLSAIIDDSRYRGLPSLAHYNSYHLVWNEGIAASEVTGYRFRLVRTKRHAPHRLPLYTEFIRENTDLVSLAYWYTKTDLLLTRGRRPVDAALSTGRWDPVRSSGEWTVFENNQQPVTP